MPHLAFRWSLNALTEFPRSLWPTSYFLARLNWQFFLLIVFSPASEPLHCCSLCLNYLSFQLVILSSSGVQDWKTCCESQYPEIQGTRWLWISATQAFIDWHFHFAWWIRMQNLWLWFLCGPFAVPLSPGTCPRTCPLAGQHVWSRKLREGVKVDQQCVSRKGSTGRAGGCWACLPSAPTLQHRSTEQLVSMWPGRNGAGQGPRD